MEIVDRLTVPDPSELGPKMRALTEKQRGYVIALAHVGGKETQAAVLAGVPEGNAARQYAYQMRNNKKVQDAIREWVHSMMHIGAVIGAKAMIDIANDPLHKDRLKAADRLMERAGMIVVQKQEVEVRHTDTLAEIVAEIKRDAALMNMDPRPLLRSAGVPSDIIDAEFEELQPTIPALPPPERPPDVIEERPRLKLTMASEEQPQTSDGAEGLEDLL